ncbi:MAG: hypothetical protein ACRDV4_11705 [Acidimicrobiales bacterium]
MRESSCEGRVKLANLTTGVRFGWKLVRFLRQPPPSVDASRAALVSELESRTERFLHLLDIAVWSVPASPYRKLFEVAGVEAGDVKELVEKLELEGALERLRDLGVYVTSDEWAGTKPIRRGSAAFEVRPQDFFNPLLRPDYFGSTGASRSSGTPVASTFASKKASQHRRVVRLSAWEVAGAPTATWFPVLPSSAGFNSVTSSVALRQPVERWFSQVDPALRDISEEKRLAVRLLPLAARLAGTRIPRPELATPSQPGLVLDWCLDALRRRGRALLSGYTSSLVSLARAAAERHRDLSGLVLATSGEPLTQEKTSAILAVNAVPLDTYAFAQVGGVATACTHRPVGELHVWETDVAVITREGCRPDGRSVSVFLWTTLQPSARNIFVNVSSDDYGVLRRDDQPCTCGFGSLGFRTTVGQIRGLSKVVTGGITLPPDVLHDVVERQLPQQFGGTPVDYQFLETEVGGRSCLVLRVDPALRVDDAAVLQAVSVRLRASEAGMLADEVWETGVDLRVQRQPPVPTRSGKVLALETLEQDPGDPPSHATSGVAISREAPRP